MLLKRGEQPEIPIKSIQSLNNKIWGFRRGEVTIIGARTSNGKSAFSGQLAFDMAMSGHRVLFLSLEMPVIRILERMFCYYEKIDSFDLMRGEFNLKPQYREKWENFKKMISTKKIIISDYIGATWKEIDETVSKFSVKPDVIFVDHIHHIKGSGSLNDKQNIDDYLLHFREMTIRNNFVGIICAQINRTSQEDRDGEPQPHHLKGTGKLEEIADNILLLWWPWHSNEKKPKNVYNVNIAKSRYGMPGKIELDFKPQYSMFSDLIKTEIPIGKQKELKVWEE